MKRNLIMLQEDINKIKKAIEDKDIDILIQLAKELMDIKTIQIRLSANEYGKK